MHRFILIASSIFMLNSVLAFGSYIDTDAKTAVVIDATTGQNALKQIEEFNKYTPITGVILTKFDSNAAGGTVVSLSNSTDIPVLAIGSGESINDIESFDPDKFSKSLVNN